jgi:site-specific DNA recombinase
MTRGIKSPSGEDTWYSSAGKAIEENVMVYQGHLVYNRHNERINKKRYKGGKKWRDRSEWVIHENAHDRCISDEVAMRISSQLDRNRRERTNPGPKHYLLTDILYCGDCGSRMVGSTGFYACMKKLRNPTQCANNKIKAEFFDGEILKFLKENLITEDFYQKFVETIQEQYRQYKKESLTEQEQHLKRIAEIETQIERLMSLFSRGKIKP